ncbi:HD-GYP domain-containing protein [Cytobacillus dafuensis]|uniref:HD domain-containing protein n=1 Tax=Cytobacillus dafuensis TaxID=1742359 RepID=A0A5B8Z9L2_CYTDA|nr:HD domain-containing phosphohydrolase [Cytobacillus dafuensis]QED48156.1 HD domain-containing protein [Cytobacillus dafuensis]
MRLINIDDYNPIFMQLARPVFDRQRRVLLAAGRTIHPVYLERLESIGVRYLLVEDALSEGISMDEIVDATTWIAAIEIIQKAFQDVAQKGNLPIITLQKLVSNLVEEVSKRKAIILFPTTSLAEDLREYAHAVNVALLSLHLANKKQIPPNQLKDVGMGALLHDIGNAIKVSDAGHPLVGFNFLRNIREISLLSAHMAYQHHEKVDGTGFPRGIAEDQIHEFAQICSIANMYDNLLSSQEMPPHEVMEYIMTKAGTDFSMELVQLFVEVVPSYIPGTRVIMNNGREAIITKIKGSMQRPYIRFIESGEEVSLVSNPTLLIKEVLQKG